ncbi:MAG: DUF4157 domain-containing protein [Candidatus Methanoperedens sp.]|nr:DUF4157 domain-containing protein [Candidatus Methanoperedens sp.]
MAERAQLSVKKPEAKRDNKFSQTQKKGPSQSIISTVEQILFLQRTIGNQAVGRLLKSGVLQAKLKIGQPGDIYEQEADRVAEQVMAPSAHLTSNSASARIQRISGKSNAQMDSAPASVDQALASPGRPLEPPLRQDMEQRFGHDFSHVRVHTDENAEMSARTINAHAYTVGNDIMFGLGRFDSNAMEGRQLLAHELTHVVQQSARHAPRAVARQPADPSPPEEDEPKAKAQPKPAKCDTGCAQRWGKNTICSRWGFQLGAHEHAPHLIYRGGKATKVKDLFIPCCDSWPFSLEKYARDKLGLSGVASCTAAHGKEIATVSLLYFKGKTFEGKPVKVLCSDSLSTGGTGAHYEPKPVSPGACSDKTFETDKREVIEMSPKAMEDLTKGEINDRLAVNVCYSGAQEDLCNHNGPGEGRSPEVGDCLTKGCTPPEGTPKLKDTGWPP